MNHKTLIHHYLLKRLPQESTCVDLTAGNGHDTYFLAKNFKEVHAVDIQEKAINNTKKRCQNYDNVTYYLMDHADFYINSIDMAIYNLGYLPGSDKKIITKNSTTLQSLENILRAEPQVIIISAYRAHKGGNDEYISLTNYLNEKDIGYSLLKYNRENSPVTFIIDFSASSSNIILVDELRHLPHDMAYSIFESMLELN